MNRRTPLRRELGTLALGLLVGLPQAVAQDGKKDTPAENPNGKAITTVDKYEYMPAESLPPVKGVSNYEWDKSKPVVKFPINVWIGWAPIIVANGGTAPNKDSVFARKYGFQVELSIIDDPIKARDAFAAGKSHILWGTLDMMALFAPELAKDSRSGLRIFQQVDWSNGGDGVVARHGIKTVNDLKPKNGKKRKIALAQQSPSHYYVLSLLHYAGIDPNDVEFKFTGDAFQAAAAFASDASIDACVSWSPDIYKLSELKDCALISTTKDAKRLIADVWAARADFAKDHPEVLEGLVRGIFDGMDLVKKDQKAAAKLVEDAFKLKAGEAEGMFADAHATNCAENLELLTNRNSPTNFEATWSAIASIYGRSGLIDPKTFPKWTAVADPRIVEAVAPDYKHHKNEYTETFAPVKPDFDPSTKTAILTRVVRIHFAPNISEVDPGYDPNADKIVEEVARMAAQFGDSTIVIEGHADRSKYEEAKGLGDEYLKRHGEKVRQLSESRAQGVIDALVKKYPQFGKQKDKFFAQGVGWARPLANDALSRRVEVRVLPPEK
ncbi:MAG: phosphate ABC transporter substrate-binding/OmpA family protein [Planctomycetota bacterium]